MSSASRTLILLLCATLASKAAPVAAETCIQSGTSSIDASCSFIGGSVSGCTPDCSDTFKIFGSVIQTADVAMRDADGDTLFVLSGGSWDTNGFDLTYDTGGLQILAGGSFTMNGPGFREWSTNPSPSTQSTPSVWPIGSYIPCPNDDAETDCNGSDNNIVRFAYDPARADADVPPALAAVAIDDVVCGYYDPVTMGPTAASWSNSCFEVSNVDASCAEAADCYLEIEMDQSWLGQPSRDYPHPRRRVIETQIGGGYTGNISSGGVATADVELGQRRLCLLGTSITMLAGTPDAVAKNEDLTGRFLRFANSSAAALPLDWSYVINGLEYNAPSCDTQPACAGDCHLVSISDPRGFQEGHPAGDRVWIDYGFLSSDRFAIMAAPPVLTGHHEAGNFAAQVKVAGRLSLRNIVAVDIGTFDLWGATIDDLEWLFVSDPTLSRNALYNTQVFVFQFRDNTLNAASIHHINVVGGAGFATCDNTASTGPGTGSDSCNSGLHVFMSRGQTYRFEDISMSHQEDDCMSGISGGGGTIDVERLYCGPTGDEPSSSNFIDLFDRNNHVLRAKDIICANCTGDSNGQSVAVFKLIEETTPVSTLNRVSLVAPQGPFNEGSVLETSQFSNLFVSGHRPVSGSGPANVEFFVIEDTRSDLDLVSSGTYWRAESLSLLRNGIVRNSSLSGQKSVLEHPDNGLVDNVLFLNLDKAFDNALGNALVRLRVNATLAAGAYRNVTFAYQSGISPLHIDTIFDANDLEGTAYDVNDILIADTPNSVSYGVSTTNISGLNSAGWCLFNAGLIADAANFPPDTLFDVDPEFASPTTGDFRTPSGGSCGSSGIRAGIDTPGLKEDGYYLSALHLSPKILNQMDGIEWILGAGVSDGRIEFLVDGVTLVVAVSAGESAIDVAQDVADAINEDIALTAGGITATVSGATVTTEGLVYGVVFVCLTDTDNDGICDGVDPDDDNDGEPDSTDPCPLDPSDQCPSAQLPALNPVVLAVILLLVGACLVGKRGS